MAVLAVAQPWNQETGLTSVYNDGDGIDVAKHKTYDVFVPSLIFGELLTSSNYKKDQKRITRRKWLIVIFTFESLSSKV